MPRVNTVKKARKSPGPCGKCGKPIEAGQGYIHWSFRYGGKRIRCLTCPPPRPSELTGSDKLSRCYAAGEAIEDAVEAFRKDFDFAGLQSALEEAANEVREVSEEYRESSQNIEDGFGHSTQQSDELNEKGDNLESKADEIENGLGAYDEFDEENVDFDEEGVEVEEGQSKEDAVKKAKAEAIQQAKEDWAEEIASEVEQLTDVSPD